MKMNKCGIIGCGNVGGAIAYTLATRESFSEIVLIDKDMEKAIGEAMDINHCSPFTSPFNIYGGDYKDLMNCSIVIITAGAPQTDGESRLDLVNKNIKILKTIIPQITAYNKDCILIVVSNPVDILTYATQKLSGFPINRVIGSGTILDTARLKAELSEHLRVDSRNAHAFIIGEHGDSELAVWSSANIAGMELKEFCNKCNTCQDCTKIKEILPRVKESAYSIIEKKGSTSYGIAMAVHRLCEGILKNENCILTVSTIPNGEYGIKNTAIGLPAIINRNGIREIIELKLSSNEKHELEKSVSTLYEITQNLNLA